MGGARAEESTPIMESLDFQSPAVQSHLEMLQGVIQRMAENSRSCKLWSITALSAVLFLAARTGVPWHSLIALVPLSLFFLLDVYYLSLERRFRNTYSFTLEKLQNGTYGPTDAYQITPVRSTVRILTKCLGSPSVYLYYPPAVAVTLVIYVALHLLASVPS